MPGGCSVDGARLLWEDESVWAQLPAQGDYGGWVLDGIPPASLRAAHQIPVDYLRTPGWGPEEGLLLSTVAWRPPHWTGPVGDEDHLETGRLVLQATSYGLPGVNQFRDGYMLSASEGQDPDGNASTEVDAFLEEVLVPGTDRRPFVAAYEQANASFGAADRTVALFDLPLAVEQLYREVLRPTLTQEDLGATVGPVYRSDPMPPVVLFAADWTFRFLEAQGLADGEGGEQLRAGARGFVQFEWDTHDRVSKGATRRHAEAALAALGVLADVPRSADFSLEQTCPD